MKKVPVSTIVPFGLRLQPDLKSRLEDAAVAAGRSLNAEIAERLARSFDARIPEGVEQRLREITDRIAAIEAAQPQKKT